MVYNLRDKLHTVHGRLFQAAMWRRYAMDWDGPLTFANSWTRSVSRISHAECIRRARINVYLARRINRRERLVNEDTHLLVGGCHE